MNTITMEYQFPSRDKFKSPSSSLSVSLCLLSGSYSFRIFSVVLNVESLICLFASDGPLSF